MKKIALIDDEQMLLDLYKRVLQNDFEVVIANNGKDGLELIKKEKPDLALVDVQMPELNGLDLIQKLKNENLLTFPVIILTNYAKDVNVSKAIDLGAKEYILKIQTTPAEVLEKIKGYLNE